MKLTIENFRSVKEQIIEELNSFNNHVEYDYVLEFIKNKKHNKQWICTTYGLKHQVEVSTREEANKKGDLYFYCTNNAVKLALIECGYIVKPWSNKGRYILSVEDLLNQHCNFKYRYKF